MVEALEHVDPGVGLDGLLAPERPESAGGQGFHLKLTRISADGSDFATHLSQPVYHTLVVDDAAPSRMASTSKWSTAAMAPISLPIW